MNTAELAQVGDRVDKGRELTGTIAELMDKRQKVNEGGDYLEIEFTGAGRFCLAMGTGGRVWIKQFQAAICGVLVDWITELEAELRDL